MAKQFKYELGVEVKDILTGFRGIVKCRTQWLYNCNTYGVQSTELKDGDVPKDVQYFDEPQLQKLPGKKKKEKGDTGGAPVAVPQTNRN